MLAKRHGLAASVAAMCGPACLSACLFVAMAAAAEAGPAATTRPEPFVKPAPPAAAAVAEANGVVRRAFPFAFEAAPATRPATTRPAVVSDAPNPWAGDSSSGGPWSPDPAALGRRFLGLADRTDGDPALRFVLFGHARDFAAAEGDAWAALVAVGRMDGGYRVGAIEVREAALVALTTAAAHATTPADVAAVADGFAQLIEASLAVGDLDLAARAAAAARPPADRTKHAILRDLIAGPAADAGKAAGAVAAPAPKSGPYLCFLRGDWDAGLPALRDGPDKALADLAGKDLAGKEPSALADAWWAAADKANDRKEAPARDAMRRRAAYWYRLALPAVPAADRDRAAARLAEVRSATWRPGLLADLYDGENFERRRGVRVDADVRFDWKRGAPDPRLRDDQVSICWQGVLVAPAAGEYEFEAAADDAVVVIVDGRDLIDAWHVAGPPTRTKVNLTAGPHAFELLYDERGGAANVALSWRPPGAEKLVPVPTASFRHDPAWPWGPVAVPLSARPAAAAPCPAPGGATPSADTVWFYKYPDRLPWHAAERRCEQAGGHLAWARHPAHAECLYRIAGDAGVWLGGTDELSESRWDWTSGERIAWELYDWLEREPNGGRGENYLELAGGGWNDSGGRKPFVGQWER